MRRIDYRWLLLLLVMIALSLFSCGDAREMTYCGTVVEKYKSGDEDGSRMIVVVQVGNEKMPLRVLDYSYVNSDVGQQHCYKKKGRHTAILSK